MKLIVCIDKNGGMMFNRRRQSRDRVMIENLSKHIKGEVLNISPYSEPLFAGTDIRYLVCESPAASAEDGYAFIEDTKLPEPSEVNELVVYNWCEAYPSDVRFDFDLSSLKRVSKEKFKGYSHEKITKEVYKE